MCPGTPGDVFECKVCGDCCRQRGFVYVAAAEAARMAEFLGLDEFAFINDYCELLDRRRLVLRKGREEDCVFLRDSACRVYPARPSQCRDFPLLWSTPRSRDYCRGSLRTAQEGS